MARPEYIKPEHRPAPGIPVAPKPSGASAQLLNLDGWFFRTVQGIGRFGPWHRLENGTLRLATGAEVRTLEGGAL